MSKESRYELLQSVEEELKTVYKEYGLTVPSNYKYIYKDTNLYGLPDFIGHLNRREEEEKKAENKKESINHKEDCGECNSFCLTNDLDRTISDLMYFTGLLYLYHSYINNPLDETMLVNGKSFSSYHQTREDRRYSLYVSCCFEKWYNYWDRIGDVLHCFVPSKMKPRQVDFNRIITEIDNNPDLNSHESFLWFKSFKENEYASLNNRRKEIVHYKQFETQFRYLHAVNSTNLDKIQALWEKKSGMKELFKNELERCTEGWYHLVKFGEYVNEIKEES